MDDENLQSKINRLSHSELAKILLDAAADPEVRDHIAAAVETSEVRRAIYVPVGTVKSH
jgi:hypothetical protein